MNENKPDNMENNNDNAVQFPKEIKPNEPLTIKINGKRYTIKHWFDPEDKYGKFCIWHKDKQIKVIDYQRGHRFHGVDFEYEFQAYDAVKKFLANTK